MNKKVEIYRLLDFFATGFLGFGVFLNMRMVNFFMICTSIMLIVISRQIGDRKIKETVESYEKVCEFKKIDVRLNTNVKENNHNIYIVMGKKDSVIVLDRGILNALSNEELEASYLHEIGHLYTIRPNQIFWIKIIGGTLCGISFHGFIYEDLIKSIIYMLCIIGIILAGAGMYLEKYIEYKADGYAIQNGAKPDALARAIEKIDHINNIGELNITMGSHPKTPKRIKRILQYKGNR